MSRARSPTSGGVTAWSLAGWLGPTLDRVRLNAVERRVDRDGRSVVAKRRYGFSRWLIPPGNLYLRWLRAGVAVLGDREWQARERAIHRALYGVEIATDARGWLILPAWPGLTLAEFVGETGNPPEARLAALRAASQALQTLHRVQIPWPGDPHGGVGHGDAMFRNVQCDPTTRRACWFDFDMMPLPSVEPTDRPLRRRPPDLAPLGAGRRCRPRRGRPSRGDSGRLPRRTPWGDSGRTSTTARSTGQPCTAPRPARADPARISSKR